MKSKTNLTIRKILFGLLVLSGLFAKSQNVPYVVPNQDYKQFFSQRDIAGNVPSAIDANNSVFSTGYMGTFGTSAANLVALKYDSLGVLQYSLTYDNGGMDNGKAIKVNPAGEAFIAGYSDDPTTGYDYIVIKVAPNGTQLWAVRFDGSAGGGIDEATDICFDPMGNVLVTGKSFNGTDYDIVTLKLNGSTGAFMWQHTFNGSSSLDDVGTGIAISANGQFVYVIGNTTDAGNGTDIVAYCLSSTTGLLTWGPVITNGTANTNDKSYSVIMHGTDIALCGEINNTGTGLDYIVQKLDGTSGAVLWQQEYDNSNNTNRATSLVRDSTGNIAVVGTVLNGSLYEYHTVLYDPTGTQYAVSIEATGLNSLIGYPKIACDTIAHHWYVAGEKLTLNRDVFVYQLAPSGNTAWRQIIDGQNNQDGAPGLSVNGVGVVYVVGMAMNPFNYFDFMTVKLNQTPVYFPPDLVTGETPIVSHLFYENKGQIMYPDSMKPVQDIVFATHDFYPYTFFKTGSICYKFTNNNDSIGGSDTTQRIDINMVHANPLATAYPYEPRHGNMSFMIDGMPNAVTNVQGYERYFIPNIYPSIDLHYYSNSHGIKMYYVLKPFANPANIQWNIAGSTSNGIVGAGSLEISAFKGSVIFDQPIIYTVDMAGNPVPITTSIAWASYGANQYGLSVGTLTTGLPYIIEIDYGNSATTSPSSIGNQIHCTYYGGFSNEGINSVDVDQNNGNFITVGATAQALAPIVFPVISGSLVAVTTNTTTTWDLLTMVLFDQNGTRKAVNTYGIVGKMQPLDAVLHGDLITIVGNNTPATTYTANLPLINSSGPLTPGTYSFNSGYGYIAQFKFNNVGGVGSINQMTWRTRLNGFASDIDKTPDGQFLYVSSSTYFGNSPISTQTVAGAYNYGNPNPFGNNIYYFQLWKFNAAGVRQWSTIFPAPNSAPSNTITANKMNNNCNVPGLETEYYLKCKIACDNYGFSLAGETNMNGLVTRNKYSVPTYTTHTFLTDGFFARFDKKDDLVYTTYNGGAGDEAYTDIAWANDKESVMVGYSNSNDLSVYAVTTPPAAAGNAYVDNAITNGNYKVLITKFDTTGRKTYSSYWGANYANKDITAWGVASDRLGKIFITGSELGANMSLAINGAYNQNFLTASESFMLTYNDYMAAPIHSTEHGGKREDCGLAIAYNAPKNRIIKVGITNTTFQTVATEMPFFPIVQEQTALAWFQPNINGVTTGVQTTYDGFIAFFDPNVLVGVEEYFQDNTDVSDFNLFPNPAQTECNLAFKRELKGKVLIEVFNQLGQLVKAIERTDIMPHAVVNLNTHELINGIYIVKIQGEGYTESKKLVISK